MSWDNRFPHLLHSHEPGSNSVFDVHAESFIKVEEAYINVC